MTFFSIMSAIYLSARLCLPHFKIVSRWMIIYETATQMIGF